MGQKYYKKKNISQRKVDDILALLNIAISKEIVLRVLNPSKIIIKYRDLTMGI